MNRITISQSSCKVETTSTWLVSLIQFAKDINFFKPFQAFKLNMKKKNYSVFQKLTTIMASVMMGCESTKDINPVLSSEVLAANMLGMEHFPDQSQINVVLNRMDQDSVNQLQEIHCQLFMEHSNSLSSIEDIVVDIDQSGLVASAKTYELAEKGYFPHKRGKTGYQVSAAFVGEYSEILDFYLDPGNVHCQDRLDSLVSSIRHKLSEQLGEGRVILRADSGYGAFKNIQKLMAVRGLKFIVKGYSSRKAASIAAEVPFDSYEQADDAAWVYELPSSEGGLRTILVQILGSKGELTYTLLHTNISKSKLSVVEAFYFYNGRQTIEAFFKTAKNVYGIKSLRTSSFYGIYGFLWLAFMTHNLISWFRLMKLQGTKLTDIGVKTLIQKCSRIKGFVERTASSISVRIEPLSKLAKWLADALSEPECVQLSFLT
ncbi:MAG TPA: transposase [Bacillota bacterium]|nr:transposase [Bacillota bacterium]